MDMTHSQKVDHLITELGQQGVSSYKVAPPLFRLLWALGLEVPPPLFIGFRQLTVLWATIFGVPFGIMWGAVMWLWVWQGELPAGIAILLSVFAAVLAGLSWGLIMAWIYRRSAARFVAGLGLPSSWEDYPRA